MVIDIFYPNIKLFLCPKYLSYGKNVRVISFNPNLFFVAVATHKYVISFCVGLELYNANTPKLLYAAYMIVYAMMSMIGIAIGIAVTTSVEDNTFAYMITVGVLQVQ